MLNFLRRHSGLRSVAANAAAFVFALQLILAGLISTQMAANAAAGHASFFELCYGAGAPSDDGSAGTKVFHQTCAVCAFSAAAPPLPEVAAAGRVVFSILVVHVAVEQSSLTSERRHESRSSQGPPQTA
ncbi:MAG TPA: hypothetical protein VM867_11400 [Xanthobacteraceae bacterium]|nr:hypothetical protein [Xanthobacteraceae bacterium]